MKDYIELAKRTEPDEEQYKIIAERNEIPQMMRIDHALMGLVTEVGELLDARKKTYIYGNDFDVVNFAEEIGDLYWYTAILVDAVAVLLNKDPEALDSEIKSNNIAKLAGRFPDKFSEYLALNRNLEAERLILETITE